MPALLLALALACAADPSGDPAAPPPSPAPVAAPPAEEVAPQVEEVAPQAPEDRLRDAPEGFVDLSDAIPGVRLDVRYHTADNFTGAPLPGYGAPGAWLREEPARALAAVQRDLSAEGLGLLVYDAYRPLRGTLGMVAWAERTGNTHLLDDGYVARRSNHNRGNTVDLTLVDLTTGEPLDMGVPWDTLTEAAHTRNATGQVLAHRQRLVQAMRRHGWVNYWKEWWHFTWQPDQKPPHRDVPYGCFEPDEGAWTPPEGWSRPGFVPPSTWPAEVACPRGSRAAGGGPTD